MRALVIFSLLAAVWGGSLAQAVGQNPVKPANSLRPELQISQQTGEPAAPAQRDAADVGPHGQRIRTEDSRARIDEVRMGGQTQSIQVQPKGAAGLPGYEVLPDNMQHNRRAGRDASASSAGQRVWNLLKF